MKINNINKIFLLGAVSLSLFSCMDDDQDYPAVDKPTATISPMNVTAAEGDTVTFTITLDKPAPLDSTFKLEYVEGEATDTKDVTVDAADFQEFDSGVAGYSVDIPALATTTTFDVIINEDIFADVNESGTYRFRPLLNFTSNVEGGDQLITINIDNTQSYNGFTSEDLGIELKWEGIVSFSYLDNDPDEDPDSENPDDDVQVTETDYDLCALDYDIFIVNPDGTADYQAATGACPETAVISATSPDGTYQILVDLYQGYTDGDGENEVVTTPLIIPVTLTVANIGASDAVTTFDDTFLITSPDSANEGASAVVVATVVKTGTNYVVTNEVIGEVFYQ